MFNLNGSNSITEIIEFLKKLKKSDFSSDLHYIYYTRYVKPKLSSLNKEYATKAFGKEIRKKTKVNIYVSQRYIVLRFLVESKRHGNWFTNLHAHTFVIGINDDYRLFVNRVDVVPDDAKLVAADENRNELYIVDDSKVHRVFEFSQDVAQEDIVIAEGGRYRVQGEIVIEVLSTPCNLHQTIERDVLWYIERLYTNIVAMLLQMRGFHINVEGGRIVLPSSVRRGASDEEIRMVKKAIKSELGDPIAINGFIFYYDIYAGALCHYGEVYCDLQLNVRPHCTSEDNDMCAYILSQVHSAINELKKSNFKHVLGNHVIELRNVYSRSMIITPSLPPDIRELAEMVEPLRAIEIDINNYCVDKDSEIVISHHEHGITKVRFGDRFLVRLRTTAVDERFPMELNRILLSKLLKQSKEKKET